MKNLIATCLILMMVLPAFLQWLPHGSLHALHEYHTAHHAQDTHDHGHSGHSHDEDQRVEVHHPMHFDAVTYFKDYLHVDLQNPEHTILIQAVFDNQDIDYFHVAVNNPYNHYELASNLSRAPPDTRRQRLDKTPVYLSTQRLRI